MGQTPGRMVRPTGAPPIAAAVGTVQPAPSGTPAPMVSESASIAAADPVNPKAKTSYLQSAPDPLIDSNIADRYRVLKKLGEGGMGSVYLALHTVLEKQVALKVLHGEFARKPDLVERFMQEARAASRIRHENVIDISDYGQTPEGLVFFAMEMLNGHDLHEEIARARLASNLLPWTRTKKIFLQICSALAAAHARGIIHRDLKPENIYLIDFLGEPDFVKLLDFGIAKQTDVAGTEGGENARKLTKTGMLFGTPEYMSPEQARGDKVDHRVDIYAMGCILFQLITNQVPFQADNFMGMLAQHLTADPPQLSPEVLDQIGAPREIADIVDKALTKDPNTRWQTIDEMSRAIRVACGDAPASETMALRAASVQAPSELTRKRTPTGTATPLLGIRAKNITGPGASGSAPSAAEASGTSQTADGPSTSTRRRTAWTGNLTVPEVSDETGARPKTGGSKLPLIIGGVVLLAGGIIAAVVLGGGKGSSGTGPGSAVATGSGSAAVVVAGSGSAVVPPPDQHTVTPPVEPVPEHVTIVLDSTPHGALVFDAENEKMAYGKTPATISVLGSRTARHFKLVLKGYGDMTVEVMPTRAKIDFTQPLTKGAKPTTASVPDTTKADPGAGTKPDPGTAVTKPDPGAGSGSGSAATTATKPDPKPDPGAGSGSSGEVQQLKKPDCPDPDEPCLKSFP